MPSLLDLLLAVHSLRHVKVGDRSVSVCLYGRSEAQHVLGICCMLGGPITMVHVA